MAKKKKNSGNAIHVPGETKEKLSQLAQKNTRTLTGQLRVCVDHEYDKDINEV